MSHRLPTLSSSKIITILHRHGFIRVRQSGSHAIFRHPDGRRVTVPVHSRKDLGRGLLRQIMKDAGIAAEDL